MKRLKRLNLYQKGVLIALAVMVLVFSVLYPVTTARVGFAYQDAIFVPREEAGGTVYSGKLQGQPASFTLSADKTVVFQWGEKTYGPYTATEDPTAIPEDSDMAVYMTGVELRQGEELLFRGGVLETEDTRWLYNEDGTLHSSAFPYKTNAGAARDENGVVTDPVAPSAATILELMRGPELTHKGQWPMWLGGVLFCGFTALWILFADELFRWHLSFQIRDTNGAEPTDWEIGGRYLGWTILPILALVLFLVGLQ